MTQRPHPSILAIVAALALAASAPAALAEPATTPNAASAQPVQLPPPPPGKGQVVFYRKPLFSLVPFNWIAREGTAEICEMVAGAYCIATVDPGTHTYEVHSEAKNDLTLEIDAGETYYVIGGISMGLIVNHPNISPADKAQFDAISARLKALPPIAAPASTAAAVAATTPAAPVSPSVTPPPAAVEPAVAPKPAT